MADIEVSAAGTTMPMFPPTTSSESASAPPQSRTVTWMVRFAPSAEAPTPEQPVTGLVSTLNPDGDSFVRRWTGVDGVDVEMAVDADAPRRSAAGFLAFPGLEGGSRHQFTATTVAWDGRRSRSGDDGGNHSRGQAPSGGAIGSDHLIADPDCPQGHHCPRQGDAAVERRWGIHVA